MDVGAVFDRLAQLLGSGSERFAVVGGYALLAHGVQRLTFDLDILVRSADQARLVDGLEDAGYETLHRSSGFSNHLHSDSSLGRLDVIYVDEDSARRIFRGSARRLVAGRSVPVVSIPVLAAMKLHAIDNDPSRRLQDLADIRALLDRAPNDREAVRDIFIERGRTEWLADVGLRSVSKEPDGE